MVVPFKEGEEGEKVEGSADSNCRLERVAK
jgi:hypothetical protein